VKGSSSNEHTGIQHEHMEQWQQQQRSCRGVGVFPLPVCGYPSLAAAGSSCHSAGSTLLIGQNHSVNDSALQKDSCTGSLPSIRHGD
jgi:hypothetical protein